jgi:hypothetical protein
VACVEEACKEPVQKIRENVGTRKAEERMKERETVVGVEKCKEQPLHVVNLYNVLEQR